MSYIENPKTMGSGIICAIPQRGECKLNCIDCFAKGGRSYLEPIEKNVPNLPPLRSTFGRVVRMNDMNDSNCNRYLVMDTAETYRDVFLNTRIPRELDWFKIPVVLTVNPGDEKETDGKVYLINPIPKNLMFVRIRTNMWNLELVNLAVDYYSKRKVPIVLTFMAYYTVKIPKEYEQYYTFRKRTLNSYWVITQEGWDLVMSSYKSNPYVYTCGKDANTHACSRCGNCLREYFATMERIRCLA